MAKANLLQQALLEEKKLILEKKRTALKGKMNRIDVLHSLLPQYEPNDKQTKYHAAESFEKGLKGGYGSGKTMAFAAEAILLSYLNRPYWIVLSSVSDANAHTTVLPHLKELCDKNGYDYTFTKTDGHFQITFGKGSENKGNIYLIGDVFYKGPNVAAVGLDEPFSQKQQTYKDLVSRVRHPEAKVHQVFWAGTAEPLTMNWGWDYFKKDENTEELFTITLSTRENKFVSEEYVKQLMKRFTKREQEVYIEGKCLNLVGALSVYHTWDPTKNIFSDSDNKFRKNANQVIVSFDFEINPMVAVEIILDGKVRRQVGEHRIFSSNTDELCDVIIDHIKRCYKPGVSVIITGDAAGRKKTSNSKGLSDYMIIQDKFSRSGLIWSLFVPESNPLQRDRTNYVNNLIEKRWYMIEERCSYTIKDREFVQWKDTGEGFTINKSKQELTHLSDAADYGLWLTRRMGLDNDNEDEGNISGIFTGGRR